MLAFYPRRPFARTLDAVSYMELVRANAQGELTAVERGMHALRSGMDVKAYAAGVGRARTSVQDEVKAARVADAVTHVRHDLSSHFRSLGEIHAAPRWLWPALVERLVNEGLTVEATRKLVADLKDFAAPPSWAGAEVEPRARGAALPSVEPMPELVGRVLVCSRGRRRTSPHEGNITECS